MGEYVYSVALGAVLVSVILCLSPDGENGRLGRFIAFIGALVMSVILLLPLADGLSGLDAELEGEESFGVESELGLRERGEYIARGAGAALQSIYGISYDKMSAYAEFSDAGELERVVITVYGECPDEHEAEKMLRDVFDAPIEIEIG
ncbi:MAG: hypothetical protein IJD22_00525 [Clostridia bacterium]|nr:hypothetical protein [Clostridia bacterium]